MSSETGVKVNPAIETFLFKFLVEGLYVAPTSLWPEPEDIFVDSQFS